MKQPSQFDKSLYCTTATMIAFYVGTSVVFYFSFGSGVPVSPRRGPAGPRARAPRADGRAGERALQHGRLEPQDHRRNRHGESTPRGARRPGLTRSPRLALQFFHVLVGYVITSQVVNRALHTRLAPQTVGTGGKREALQWCVHAVGGGWAGGWATD